MRTLLVYSMAFLLVTLTACGKTATEKEKAPMNQQFIGEWSGDIEIPKQPLPIQLTLDKDKGTFSVPVQGLHDYPFEKPDYDGDAVAIRFILNQSTIQIEGELKDGKIAAVFKQNGGSFPLVLSPVESSGHAVTYETISIPVKGGELKAALQRATVKPEGSDQAPVALILAGSGPTNKDGNSMGAGKNDSLKLLAEGLAAQGIASIRYDKRGIGENMALAGSEEELSFDDFVEDAAAAIELLSSMKEFTSVHVIGHSEGSLIGMIAANTANAQSYVSLAGAGKPIDEVLLAQLKGQLSPKLFEESEAILQSLKNGKSVSTVSPDLNALFRASVQPYLISWLAYNPAQEIKKLHIPALILQGNTDIQVLVEDAKALAEAKSEAKLHIVEGMNHVLKKAPADREQNLATYSDQSLPLHEELIPLLSEFILSTP
ncbi:alpha/beta hydrolase [Paenibacillus sp. NPDC058071]|uniref:alpha/beta hydrolase n=1 Tax=Paenibacillus sp. NPDC058071 TaxID=3346326 RepID=UPI0036D766CB